jgi:hypothetical protein
MPETPRSIKRMTPYPSRLFGEPASVHLDDEVGMALQDQVIGYVLARYLVFGILLDGVV